MDAKNFALTSSARPFNRVERLNRGGRLILYSGTPIIGGADPLFEALQPFCRGALATSATRKSTQMFLVTNSTARPTPAPIASPPSASQPPKADEFRRFCQRLRRKQPHGAFATRPRSSKT